MIQTLRLYVLLFVSAYTCHAQTDTVRIATYNLLNYGNSANPVAYKNQRLKPILQEIRPAIQCFNEVSTAVPGLLDTLLAVMPSAMEHGRVHNTTSTTQLDGLFWRQGAFRLLHDTIICNTVRDIVAYDLYWEYPGLSTYHDTLRLTVITAHLKSSNTTSDKADRAGETQKVSAYLSTLTSPTNVVMLGDFNLYTSSEVAYQNLINPANPDARLNDPINRAGSWDNNSAFADIHTQSTRVAALPDGGASSGLDSRFDFILVSDAVLSGAKGIWYVPSSYRSFGNDGQHYGKALTDPPANSAVSAFTAQALYECSDHLPVLADFVFTPPHLLPSNGVSVTALHSSLHVVNPFNTSIQLLGPVAQLERYWLYTIEGRIVQRGCFEPDKSTIIEVQEALSPGIYMLRLQTAGGTQATLRLVHY